jgi:hypothetical protein
MVPVEDQLRCSARSNVLQYFESCGHAIDAVPMTRRSDILKVFAVAAVLAGTFYYLANYGLHPPS